MKRILALVLCFVLLGSMTAFAAEGDITVTVNGAVIDFDVPPQIVEGRTMLPVRAIFEALGANVSWVQKDKLIFATKGDTMIVMQIDNKNMNVQKTTSNEGIAVTLDVAPMIVSDRTLVPARAIAEALGAKVEWVNDTRTVVITL